MKLRWKLTAVMLLVALLPLGLAAAFMVDSHVSDLAADARKYNVATSDVALNRVDDIVEQGVSDAFKTAQVFAQATDKSRREEAARAQLLGSQDIHALALYLPPPQGVEEPARSEWSRRAEGRAVPAAPEFIDAALQAKALKDGRAFMPVAAEEQVRFLPIVFPVYVDHPKRLYAFAWAPIDLTRLNAEVEELSNRHHDGASDQVFVVDSNRALLAFYDAAKLGTDMAAYGVIKDVAEQALNQPLSFTGQYINGAGEEVLGVVVSVPQFGWAVVVEQRTSTVFASVDRAVTTSLGIAGGAVILVVLLGLLMAGRVSAPVVAVSRAAGKVAGGDFSVRVDVSSDDEVGLMANAFNAMAADLGDYSARIVHEARVRNDLSRYLSNEVMEQVIANPDAMTLGGERRQVTVMFADVVSFTRLTEQHDPAFLVSILNELFTIATEIVFKHGGIIDKFMGDSLMAVFGAPKGRDDDALRAVTAAEELLRWIEAGNAKWQQQLGGIALELAVGAASGTALAGNIGSERRMDYTVIGDTVNIAARLESLAKPGQMLMDGETAAAVEDDFDLVALGVVELAGRDEPVEVFGLDE